MWQSQLDPVYMAAAGNSSNAEEEKKGENDMPRAGTKEAWY